MTHHKFTKPYNLARFAVVASVAALLAATPAHARKVEDVFKGQVMALKRPPPIRFRSNAAFMQYLRKNQLNRLWPDKKSPDQWNLDFMAFFKRPLTDLEVKIQFYDITEGRQFVAGDNIFAARGQRILRSRLVLEKPKFRVNRKYRVYILTARNVALASGRFELRGKAETYSGKVVFTDDEANK